MAEEISKTGRGTGNLFQDLLSSVVLVKKCDKHIISSNSIKPDVKSKLQSLHCFICGVKHQHGPLSQIKIEILQEIILSEMFDKFSTTSTCAVCSTTLDKLINLKKEIEDISTCIRSVIKLRRNLSEVDGNRLRTNLSKDPEEHDSIIVSRSVDNVTSNNDVEKCESEEYDFVAIDCPNAYLNEESLRNGDNVEDLEVRHDDDTASRNDGNFMDTPELKPVLPIVDDNSALNDNFSIDECVTIGDPVVGLEDEEESIRSDNTGNDDKAGHPEVKLEDPINRSDRDCIVNTLELPLTEINDEVKLSDNVDVEEFVQCKNECDDFASTNNPVRDIVPCVKEPSRGLQIAKVKNEDGQEIKLFTNFDGVYDVIIPDEAIIVESMELTLESLTCPECNVSFDKPWQLYRHQRNPWLDRSGKENRKRSNETDLQNDAKRPRVSRTRAEELIKKMTSHDNLNSYDNQDDSDFYDTSDSSSSDQDSSNGEDNSPELSIDEDDAELYTKSEEYKCHKCNITFGRRYDLARHLTTTLVHAEENLRHKVGLADNQIITQSGEHKCLKCNKTYVNKHDLIRHLITSCAPKRLKGFRRSSRGTFILSPTEDEIASLTCTVCAIKFDDPATLTKHKSMHTNKCDICRLKCTTRRGLRRHLQTQSHALVFRTLGPTEEELTTLQCTICSNKFDNLPTLMKHKVLHLQKCEVCNVTYPSFRDHLQSRKHKIAIRTRRSFDPTEDEISSLKCSVCARKFNDVATLTIHRNKYKETCEICDTKYSKTFKLHSQTRIHSVALRTRKFNDDDVVLFRCDKCDEAEFPDALGIFQHVKQMHKLSLGPIEEEIATLRCTICCDKFDDLITLLKHKTLHFDKCEMCNYTCRRIYELKVHLKSRLHQSALRCRRFDPENKVSFVCDQCPDETHFPDHPQLINHKKKYHPENIFCNSIKPVKSCVPCNKSFNTKKGYKSHFLSALHAKNVEESEELEKKKVFACTHCDRKYASKFLLERHLKIYNRTLICEICSQRYPGLVALKAHQKTHGEPKKTRVRFILPEDKLYPCKFCDKRFTTLSIRSRHVECAHKEIRHKCDLCLREFRSLAGYRSHQKKVHNLENKNKRLYSKQPAQKEKAVPQKCDVCSKTMVKGNMVPHTELVHFQDKSKCPYGCSELEFETEQDWIQHLEGCTSEKITEASRCSCFFCGAVFRSQLLRLSHHLQAHKNFKCEICSKAFTQLTILNVHKYSHKESKPHLCPKCGKRFKQAWNLKLHLTLVCGDDEEARQKMIEKRKAQYKSFREKKMNFKCDECSEGFVSERRLELHKKKIHAHDDKSETEDSDTD
ncbi:zinc finger protein 91 isoform X2 [Folsomia candida]|uniref:zinc finger protein 91 isoform X2 n=1 Tax=Folsomia candida TaxID=158441 RepID=UPI0016050D14|nr:zinc finger protein 91 isoform X2 [Folsomia candida]